MRFMSVGATLLVLAMAPAAAADLPIGRRSGALRRLRRSTSRDVRSPASRRTTSRSSRTARSSRLQVLRRRRSRRGAAAAPRAAARHERQHGRRPRDARSAAIKFVNALEHAADVDARRLRHRGPRRAVRAGRLPAPRRAHPDAQAGRLDRALRCDRRLSERRAGSGRPEDPGALHRRRRHAQLAHVPRRARSAARRRTSPCTRSAISSTSPRAAAPQQRMELDRICRR